MFDDVFTQYTKVPTCYLPFHTFIRRHLNVLSPPDIGTLPAGIVVLAKIFKTPVSEDLTCLVQWPTLDCSLSPSAARPQRQPRDFPKIKISMLHLFVSPQDPDM